MKNVLQSFVIKSPNVTGSFICAIAIGLFPAFASAGMICETRIVCSDTFPCSEAEVDGSLLSRIVLATDGTSLTLAEDGVDDANARTFDAVGPSGEIRHFMNFDADGTAILLSLFQDLSILISSQGPVLGDPFVGSAIGACWEES